MKHANKIPNTRIEQLQYAWMRYILYEDFEFFTRWSRLGEYFKELE